MDYTTDAAHRALAYVEAVTRQGYGLKVSEFEAFAEAPFRLPWGDDPDGWLGAPLTRGLELQQPGAQLAQRMTESLLAWLKRLRWLSIDDTRTVGITRLGLAVLRDLEQRNTEPDGPLVVVLDKGDPLALPGVIGVIKARGVAALVDPYFRIERLPSILDLTEVERILTGPNDSDGRIAALTEAVGALDLPRAFEIRTSSEFHDRFVIPEAGSTVMLGTSLGGVGKRLSVMVELTDGAANHLLRARFEDAWTDATPLQSTTDSETNPTPDHAQA